MMKAILLSGLSAVMLTAAVVEVQATPAASPKFNLLSYTHLIDIEQSQIFGTLSMADGMTRLPVSAFRVAAVHFITNDGKQVFGGFGDNGMEFEDPTATRCQREGYSLTSCSSGFPADFCPHNNAHFKICCATTYKYTTSNCSYPNVLSKDSCGGKYRCLCDKTLYPVTDCTSPQVPKTGSGSSCTAEGTTYYADCVCPQNYSESCNGKNQKGKGTACSKNGETKYTGCECLSEYKLTCSGENSYPSKPNDYCELGGIKYYTTCGVCPNVCTVAEADKQEGIIYEYEECSKKYCPLGCAVNYKNWCVKPETDCGKLGYTKSVSQCPNGYLKCPHNSAAVYCND